MDHIITLGVIGFFIYLFYRKHKKEHSGTVSGKPAKRMYKEKDIVEVLEILIAKLDILIARTKEVGRMELIEALKTLLEYQETIVYLMTVHVDKCDADKVMDAIEEVTSYLEEH